MGRGLTPAIGAQVDNLLENILQELENWGAAGITSYLK